jgi:diguanylate cyclase (GGDEF)-like protein
MSDRQPGTSDPLLASAITAVARGGEPETVLAELLGIATEAGGAGGASAFLWDASKGALALAGSTDPWDGAETMAQAAAQHPDHPVTRAAIDRVAILGWSGAVDPDTVLCTWPIVVRRDGVDEPLGTLVLRRPAPWSIDPTDADRVSAIADLVAMTVDRARMADLVAERSEWLERLASSDALTGLANARTVSRVLELDLARATRQGTPLCVVVFDVDGLARINETAGNAAGDQALREIAAVISETVRFVDTVARWGGDEFVLIAPGATGNVVVRRILDAIAARPPVSGLRLTVSAGVARFPVDGSTPQSLIEAALDALAAGVEAGPGTVTEASAIRAI